MSRTVSVVQYRVCHYRTRVKCNVFGTLSCFTLFVLCHWYIVMLHVIRAMSLVHCHASRNLSYPSVSFCV